MSASFILFCTFSLKFRNQRAMLKKEYLCVTDDTDLTDDSLWNGQRYVIDRLATMLYYDLFQERIDKTEFKEIGMYGALALLHDDRYRYFKQEVSEIVSYLLAHLEITTTPLGDEVLACIELFGCYSREEIFTLVGRLTME